MQLNWNSAKTNTTIKNINGKKTANKKRGGAEDTYDTFIQKLTENIHKITTYKMYQHDSKGEKSILFTLNVGNTSENTIRKLNNKDVYKITLKDTNTKGVCEIYIDKDCYHDYDYKKNSNILYYNIYE